MAKFKDTIRQTKPFPSIEEEVFLNILRTGDVLAYRENQFFKQHDLTATQYNALRIIRGAGVEGVLCSDIGERMITRVPDVTRLVDRLEKQGYVTRKREAADRRAVRVRLTKQGGELLAQLDERVTEFIKGQLKHVSKNSLIELNELLDQARGE